MRNPAQRPRVGKALLGGVRAAGAAAKDALRRSVNSGLSRPLPGAPAGLDPAHPSVTIRPEPGEVTFKVYDYGPDQLEEVTFDAVEGRGLATRAEWVAVRWIDVVGLHPYVVARMQQDVGIHTLAAEDVVHGGQRPRLEIYENHLFIPIQMVRFVDGTVVWEQVSVFVFRDQVITFQERVGDVWSPLRERLGRPGTRVRRHGADYLAYALFDAIVDNVFPVVEDYGLRLESLEASILHNPKPALLPEVQAIRRELGMLRRTFGPFRKALEGFSGNEVVPLKKVSRTFLRDALGHADQLVDLIDAHWDTSRGITDLYISVASHRMNQVMKVLTILSAVFIPLTFLAGVYGMNFATLPGSAAPAAFWVFAGVCGLVATAMLALFSAWGWFER